MREVNFLYQTISDYSKRLNALRSLFDYEQKVRRLTEINEQLQQSNHWYHPSKAKPLKKEQALLQQAISSYDTLQTDLDEYKNLLDMAMAEEDDAMLADIEQAFFDMGASIRALEFKCMFTHQNDSHDTYLDIQAGSGGTEAQDWANMLLRMYLRWGERRQFNTQLIACSEGEVAGIKSATVKFGGDYAYGWLKNESGIHRLVRKSPFNANHKRHTSFASVFVYPQIEGDIDIDINAADLRIDTYRASGAGGQHVNRTDSAVRITHIPTATVVQCQSERSQHQNKAHALNQLRAKLYELEVLKREAEKQLMEASKSTIGWGHQIRSYVLDESRIKDLRTGRQSGNTKEVLDGNIDCFLEASLLRQQQ